MEGTGTASAPAPSSDLDDEFAALAHQQQETACYSESRKGKNRADDPSDEDLALVAFEAELENHVNCLNDLKIARSIARAVVTDQLIIEDLLRRDNQAREDRQLALQIARGRVREPSPSRYRFRRPDARVEDVQPQALVTSSSKGQKKTPQKQEPQRQPRQEHQHETLLTCYICLDETRSSESHSLQCSHTYCLDCLKELFIQASKDESLFPPRCCDQKIALSTIAAKMSKDEIAAFKAAMIEFSTLDRIYCADPMCGRFIPLCQIVASKARCTHCGSLTCKMCKSVFHDGDCPEDVSLKSTLAFARTQGWQRCFACKAMVELSTGCYHITCKCKSEFCYLCGVKWRRCTCRRWDERNLVERAREVVDRNARYPLPIRERQRRIGEMREQLRPHYDCNHPTVVRINNPSRPDFEDVYRRCEECDEGLRIYLLECQACHTMMCRRCRPLRPGDTWA